MAAESEDTDYRICEFLWHGPYEGEISQSWATEIILKEGETDIRIGGEYQMEWSGGRKKRKNVYPITLLKIFHSLEEARGNLVFLFTFLCHEQLKLPAFQYFRDSKCKLAGLYCYILQMQTVL